MCLHELTHADTHTHTHKHVHEFLLTSMCVIFALKQVLRWDHWDQVTKGLAQDLATSQPLPHSLLGGLSPDAI